MYTLRRFVLVTLVAAAILLPSAAFAALSCEKGGTCIGDDRSHKEGFTPISDANFNRVFNVTPGESSDLASFFNSAFRVALSLGAILAVMRIAWGGFKYMTTDASGEKNEAKEILTDVVIGLLLLLSIWLILYQINPCLLKLQVRGFTGTAYQGASDECAQR